MLKIENCPTRIAVALSATAAPSTAPSIAKPDPYAATRRLAYHPITASDASESPCSTNRPWTIPPDSKNTANNGSANGG
jgi:hypothetical protein